MNVKQILAIMIAVPGLLVCFEAQAFYNSDTGRWLNRDPLGEAGFEMQRGGKADLLGDGPILYTFVHNDPIDQIDPLGLYGSSVDNAVRTCMALPTPAARAKCINDLFGSGEFSKCCVLAAVVRAAKAGAGALGKCKSGDSCEVLRAKSLAWMTLAAARSRLNKVCYKGGDPGHQQATADAWTNVGKCTKYQVSNGCTDPL